jgi:hypothetical protein
MNLALAAALVSTVIEYPLAKRYPTSPPTNLAVRMAVAGGMTLVAVLVAQKILASTPKGTP